MTKVADNTARRMLGRAKQFFRDALRNRLILENPFDDMKGLSVVANRDRHYYVTREDAAKVFAACPNAQWRILFALARWGGFRTPSETLSLRWADVDWEHERLLVRSPKKERDANRGERVVPIFAELRPHLAAAFEQAAAGEEFVFTKRNSSKNLRTHMDRIIKKAGIVPWPKTFQNCRSTRETELMETYPIHVVCAWLGNSPVIAMKHYAQVTEEHFQKATQIATQKAAEPTRTDQNRASPSPKNVPNEANKRNLAPRLEDERMGESSETSVDF